MSVTRLGAIAVAAAVVVAGCSGGSNTATSTPTNTPISAMSAAKNAMTGTAAPIPAGLHCAGQIVWVNMKSRKYHRSDDPDYGRTKNGAYMCEAAADAKGYHLAGAAHMKGTKHHAMSGSATSAPTSTPYPSST